MFPRLNKEPELGCCILIVEDQGKNKRKEENVSLNKNEWREGERNMKNEEREREVKKRVLEEKDDNK